MKTDSQLQRDVEEELRWEPSVHSSQIGVAVKDSVVTLSGEVSSLGEKWNAECAAQRVVGVLALVIDLDVKLSALGERSDADIARSAETALGWLSAIPAGTCKVMVEKGIITLFGTVEWRYQKQAAADAVHHLPGVKGLSNQINVDPKDDVDVIEADIYAAIDRVADSNSQNIEVRVNHGEVTLTGTVNGWWVRDLVLSAVWSAPGVRHVVNLTSFNAVAKV